MIQIDRALSSEVLHGKAGSAVVAPTPAEQILPHLSLEPPRVWDWVFTCFENITAVTGGIGTYHRLLLGDLAVTNRNLLILTRRCNAGVKLPPNATLVFIDDLKPAKSFNYVGDEHDHFSLGCHFVFRSLFRAGHRFRLVEFSDYGVDGFYALRGRACGSYDLGHAVVRLHSPDVMLIEDNGKSYADLSSFHRDRIDREMSAYDDCDTILYGGEAMRLRVEELCERFGLRVGHKMRKCPHPYPLDSFERPLSDASVAEDRDFTIAKILRSNRFVTERDLRAGTLVGIFGRIEDRKGQYQMIWAALHNPAFAEYLRNSAIHFVVAGHNVLDEIGNYRLNELYSLIHSRGLQQRFHFTGRVPQSDLARFSSACAAFIYPSVFENYPNALLEVLSTCKPLAVSAHGCMPEITEGFRDVQVIDFQSFEPDQLRQFLDRVVVSNAEDRRAEFETRRAVVRDRHARMLEIYEAGWSVAAAREPAPATVGFVIPIYEDHRFLAQTLEAVRKCVQPGDQVVVVDDASGPVAALEIEAICSGADVPLLRLPKNLGPAGARKRGVEALSTDLVQFCDGDDVLDPDGVTLARIALGRDPDLTMVTGVMSCFQDANHCWVPRNGNIWTATLANYAHSGSMGRRAAMHDSLPNIRLPLNEDWLTNLRIVAAGAKCRMMPEITYHYRRFEGTRSTKNHTEVGRVHLQIIQDAMRQLTFVSPQQNARLKILLTGFGSSEGGIGLGSVVQDATPLRYQVIDAVYLRATQSRLGHAALVRARNLYLRVRKRSRPS